MYLLISRLSFIVRMYVCYWTIEQYPIFENPTIQSVFWEILSVYTILWFIAYFITGIIVRRTSIIWGVSRSIIYFLVYLVLVGIIYIILFVLTKTNMLPF